MNKSLLLIAYMLFAAYVNAQCAPNAQGNVGSCMCIQGYYGTNAESVGTCNQCPGGTTTASPSLSAGGNTNASADLSVCNQCQANYYMIAAAATASNGNPANSAQCIICPTGTGNNGVKNQGDLSQCSFCQANYYQTAVAVAASNGVTAAAVTCQSCPNGSTSTAGTAQSASDCLQNQTTNSNIILVSLSILVLSFSI
ncbi:immobilization antigen (macronuclear) [Tetrahymena thermophila SB210]|uniref:Immobilization antigen n=1 Tax=Tetrahymena thermophila (strain SB210) TaxID=312017 RepID=Q22PE2_TETTS|nr:immobilization antigen [Tetrahymena thermophila SB210]EAR87167.1 immobilization antigen [Tetrahymena thermophila SB210]|eukprot:XP_001007412.1 immobilization antigen [Tetrahymena thermophila SB210]